MSDAHIERYLTHAGELLDSMLLEISVGGLRGARKAIAALDYDPDNDYYTDFTEGYESAKNDALAIIDDLLAKINA
jgi:hypothetical protein